MTIRDLIDYEPSVDAALKAKKPVVALESTIISHGLPFPRNRDLGRALEDTVRAEGATPATIAVLDGRLKVGVDDGELDRLARAEGIAKVSRRDLSAVLARGASGGTTVAATMYVAELAGIAVFGTGGIGGVHRGAEETFDISADLGELARTRVAVVCAGAKSILDIPKTLEFLETQGVAVVGYGCDEFPAFYARASGCQIDHRCDSIADLARVVALQREIGPGGTLIANPIPEADALDADAIEARIAEAVQDARAKGIGQKAVTPFLLRRVLELTEGGSVAANIALVKNNVRVAAQVAVELARR